jgi:phosphate butyryltransferase
MFSTLEDLFKQAKPSKKRMVLAVAQDEHSIEAALTAHSKGIIDLVCVGDKKQIEKIAVDNKLDLKGIEIINEEDKNKSVEIAVKLVKGGNAQILMKGNISTSILLKGVLNKDWGLNVGNLLSHFAIFEIKAYHKLLGITDVAMNIAPNLKEKTGIINNAVSFMSRIGIQNPKIAVVSAVETVSETMPCTIDAAILSKMAERGQIAKCIIDGPLAFDNAISKTSAEHKGIKSEVAGDADILLMPDIEAGNILYKTLGFFTDSKLAAVILGAKCPIVLTSRADSEEAKLNSIYLAVLGSN